MKTDIPTKPESIDDDTWQDNQRWIKLMASQAEHNRDTRDPLLYRQSTHKGLISPTQDN
ncbi:MAG: hypothetical protein AAFZ92_00270 [Pseudomonadota bacterium]